MAATDNNVHVPGEILAQTVRLAAKQGRTVDELATEALNRYLTREWLNHIETDRMARRLQCGLSSDEQVESEALRVVSEYRKQHRGT